MNPTIRRVFILTLLFFFILGLSAFAEEYSALSNKEHSNINLIKLSVVPPKTPSERSGTAESPSQNGSVKPPVNTPTEISQEKDKDSPETNGDAPRNQDPKDPPEKPASLKGWVRENGNTYFYRAGEKLTGWQKIEGKQYFFDASGAMVTGWKSINGSWYFFDESGIMKTGWLRYTEKWYFFRNEGTMVEGWQSIDHHWYYLVPGYGEMTEGWQFISGHWYYFLPGYGEMAENWQFIGNKWYYLIPGYGEMAEGWYFLSGQWFYLLPEKGYMVEGLQTVQGVNYYFQEKQGFLHYDGSKPSIALTFDDGPGNYTADLLDFLWNQDAKVTFFIIGSQSADRESILKREYEEGHTLGNHSYNHRSFTGLNDSSIQQEIGSTDNIIRKATGSETHFYRPPYGEINNRVLSAVNKSAIFWDIDTKDWKHRDASYVSQVLLNSAKDGSIVLMHDIHSSTVEGIKRAVPELKKKGFQLVNLDMLFMLKGVTPQPYKRYDHFH